MTYLILDQGFNVFTPSLPEKTTSVAFLGYGKIIVTFVKYCPQVRDSILTHKNEMGRGKYEE